MKFRLFLIATFFLAANSVYASEELCVGTTYSIKAADSVKFISDNPQMYDVNGNAIVFTKPGIVNVKALATYNNHTMLFEENFRIIAERLSVSEVYSKKNVIYHAANEVGNSSGFQPVSAYNLRNRSLLHWNLNDAQYEETYRIAANFAKRYYGLSRKEQLKQIAQDVRKFYEDECTYSVKAPHFLDAYGFWVLHAASCQGAACAIGMVLNILGVDYEHVNHNKWMHQWCRVDVGGEYWVCDAYGLYVGPEPAPYTHPFFENKLTR